MAPKAASWLIISAVGVVFSNHARHVSFPLPSKPRLPTHACHKCKSLTIDGQWKASGLYRKGGVMMAMIMIQ